MKFRLRKTNHGIDGWDAKTTTEAYFSSVAMAVQYLNDRGFTHIIHGSFWHADAAKRNTMGAISYEIDANVENIPVDPR